MRAPARPTRRVMWSGDDVEVKVNAISDDLDDHDRLFVEMAKDIKQVKVILTGLLLSTTTAAVVGALNLLFGGGVPG